MTKTTFIAMVADLRPDGSFIRSLCRRPLSALPDESLLVRVHYSSLNYKDALSATGGAGVTRNYPHTPGIDAAGEVVESQSGNFRPGDRVIVTSYDLGTNSPGGYAQYIRVPAEWALHLPEGLSLRESMALGTAGFTAALSVLKLQRWGVTPQHGDVLVTGASGGVGSLAVTLLSALGYRVVAATGKSEATGYLRNLGAAEVIGRAEVVEKKDRSLLGERWAGAVDTVGGEMLASAVKATSYGGAVTCCGLAASSNLPLNVYPFILRGVGLIGINSEKTPMPLRKEVWERLAGPWKPAKLESITEECPLQGLEERFQRMLEGRHRGRTVVRLPLD